jgi:hypothetical protein
MTVGGSGMTAGGLQCCRATLSTCHHDWSPDPRPLRVGIGAEWRDLLFLRVLLALRMPQFKLINTPAKVWPTLAWSYRRRNHLLRWRPRRSPRGYGFGTMDWHFIQVHGW